MKTRITISTLMTLALAGLTASALTGCRGDREEKPPRQFFPDLDDQPKWEPQSGSDFFADGRMMRQPPLGTVAFGRQEFVNNAEWAHPWMSQRQDLLKDDKSFYEGKNADGSWMAVMPVTVDAALLKRGQERFGIYCAVCHGYQGDGKGMVGDATKSTGWAYAVPSYHDAIYKDASQDKGKDGYLFHTARNGVWGPDGKQKMPGYAHAVSERDAWAIVAYIRALQATKEGTIEDVPEVRRNDLMKQKTIATETPATQPAAGGAK